MSDRSTAQPAAPVPDGPLPKLSDGAAFESHGAGINGLTAGDGSVGADGQQTTQVGRTLVAAQGQVTGAIPVSDRTGGIPADRFSAGVWASSQGSFATDEPLAHRAGALNIAPAKAAVDPAGTVPGHDPAGKAAARSPDAIADPREPGPPSAALRPGSALSGQPRDGGHQVKVAPAATGQAILSSANVVDDTADIGTVENLDTLARENPRTPASGAVFATAATLSASPALGALPAGPHAALQVAEGDALLPDAAADIYRAEAASMASASAGEGSVRTFGGEGSLAGLATPRALAAQLATVFARPGDGRIDLALHPHELGRLRLTITPTEAGLTVIVTAERPETLDLMRRHAADLGQELRDLGFRDIDLSFGGAGAEQFRDGPTMMHRDTRGFVLPDLPVIEGVMVAPVRSGWSGSGLDIRL